jgi:hypothetical protein
LAIRQGHESADICHKGRGCFHIAVVRFLSITFLILFTVANARAEKRISLAGEKAIGDPLPADLDSILTTSTSEWRSPLLEVYRWDRFPDILIIDTIDLQLQDRMFTRLAYFLEKKGFRGKLMTNAQLAGRHGWNAHDYSPAGLASFFSAAAARAFPLNAEEKALEDLALRVGILLPQGAQVVSGKGGVLAVSRGSSAIERRYLLTHESFHGVFFSSAAYREFCFELWGSLPLAERRFYENFLDSLGYDGDDRFLAVNEFQAYLMQQPLEYASGYFERFLARFRAQDKNVIDPAALAATAAQLDDFLRSHFGLQAGETVLPGSRKVQGQ